METDDVVLLYTTWPDQETARPVIAELLRTRLIACANMFAPHQAIYQWDNTIRSDPEVGVLIKTTAHRVAAVRSTLIAAHPYETPAMIAIPTDAGFSHAPFMDWVRSTTQQ